MAVSTPLRDTFTGAPCIWFMIALLMSKHEYPFKNGVEMATLSMKPLSQPHIGLPAAAFAHMMAKQRK